MIVENKTNNKVLEVLNSIQNGAFFTTTFLKRNSKEIQVMNCRNNVKKHLKGGSLGYNAVAYDLVQVWDPIAHKETGNGYRNIPLEGITEIKSNNMTWKFI